MKTLHLRWMAAALTAAVCLTVFLAAQTHPAQAQTINCADTATTGIPQAECEVMMAEIAPLVPEWEQGNPPCLWTSVHCENGHVLSMHSPNAYDTSVPTTFPDLSALTHLEYIAFHCDCPGSFPAWIAASPTLKTVDIGYSQLSGTIPDLSAMVSLEELNLHYNDFSGPLPDIAMLPHLRMLALRGNNFSGTLHAGVTASTSLEWLDLRANALSGTLPDMSTMSSLGMFIADNNQFSGPLPALPPNVALISLAVNHLTGEIPASYGDLQGGYLYLNGNMLTGEVPANLHIMNPYLNYNALTATDPATIAWLTDATNGAPDFFETQTLPPTVITASNVTHTSANLSWTPILYTADTGSYQVGLSTTGGSGYVFSHTTADKLATGIALSGLTPNTTYYGVIRTVTQPHIETPIPNGPDWSLTDNPNTVTSLNSAEFSFTTGFDPDVLNCANTAMTGIPQAECETLVALVDTYGPEHFPSNWLSNTSPCTWSNLGCEDGHISGFSSATAELGGPIPDLSALTHLFWLDLRWGNFSGSIPAWITESATLESLDLGGNQLSGELPDFSGMTSLWQLFLYHNNFSGGFPTGVEHVTSLILSGNQLSGPIPSLNGTALRAIELSDNNFTGTLPELDPDTGIVNFARNSLTGVIPTSYGSLLTLDNIDLSGNDLYGQIPKSIGNLPLLGVYTQDGQAVNFSHNRLSASGSALIAKLTSENPDFFTTQTVAPADMAVSNITLVSADLSWTPIAYTADAGAYEIGLGTTSGGGYVFSHSTANKSTSGISLSGLTPGTTYYGVVRTVTLPHDENPNTVTSLNSAEFSFTTLVDPVSAPVLLSPTANGVVRGTNSPVLSWLPNPAGEGVTAYKLLLKNDVTGVKILKQTISAATCAAVCAVDLGTLAPQVDLPAGVYNWQVTATGSLGATKSLKQKFSVIKPDAPMISAPLGTVSDPQPDIMWTANPDDLNTRYKLVLVGVKSGVVVRKTVTGVCSGAACAVGLDVLAGGPYLLNNDSYTLTVTALNDIGGRKATSTFKIRFPAPAVNLAPAGGLIVNTQQPVLSWTPDTNASSFRVVLQRIKNGAVVNTYKVTNIANGTQGFVCSAGICTLDLAALASPLTLPKGNYAWTVISANPAIHPASTSKSAKAKFKVVLP